MKYKCILSVLVLGWLNCYSQDSPADTFSIPKLFFGYAINRSLEAEKQRLNRVSIEDCNICGMFAGENKTDLFFEDSGLKNKKMLDGSILHFYLLTDSSLAIKQIMVLLSETDSTKMILDRNLSGLYKEKYSWGSTEDIEQLDIDYSFGEYGIFVHTPSKKVNSFFIKDVFFLQVHQISKRNQ